MTNWIIAELGGAATQPGQRPHGQQGNFLFQIRWMGAPARSGRHKVCITCWDYPALAGVFTVVYRWWTFVPIMIHANGWRYCSVRYIM